jgi:hypothetical protein
MKIEVIVRGVTPVPARRSAHNCQQGEWQADTYFRHPLVDEETLTRILDGWSEWAGTARNYRFIHPSGADDHVVIAHPITDGDGQRKITLHDVIADDTTGLYPLDVIAGLLPAGHVRWGWLLDEESDEDWSPDQAAADAFDVDEHSGRL